MGRQLMPEGWARLFWRDAQGRKWSAALPKEDVDRMLGKIQEQGGKFSRLISDR